MKQMMYGEGIIAAEVKGQEEEEDNARGNDGDPEGRRNYRYGSR